MPIERQRPKNTILLGLVFRRESEPSSSGDDRCGRITMAIGGARLEGIVLAEQSYFLLKAERRSGNSIV